MRFNLTLIWLLCFFVLTAPGCLDRGTSTIEVDSDSVKSSRTMELKNAGGVSSLASGQVSLFMNAPALESDITVSVDSYNEKIFSGIPLATHLRPISDYHVFTSLDFKESNEARITLAFDSSGIDFSLPGNIDIYQFDSNNRWVKLTNNRSLDLEKGEISAETGYLSSFVVALYLYDPILDSSVENYIFSSSRAWKNFDNNGNLITSSDSQGYDIFVSSKADLTETEALVSSAGHQSMLGYIDVLKKCVILNHSNNTIDFMNISGFIEKSIDLGSLPFIDPIINATATVSTKIVISAIPTDAVESGISQSLALGTGMKTSKREIYTLDPESEICNRITYNDVDDYAPAWSIDGKKIFFLRENPLKEISNLYYWDIYSASSFPVGNSTSAVNAIRLIPLKDGISAILIPSGDVIDLSTGNITGSLKTAVINKLPVNFQMEDLVLLFDHGNASDLSGGILNYLETDNGAGIIELCCIDILSGNAKGSLLVKTENILSGQPKLTVLTDIEYIESDVVFKNSFSVFGCTRFNH